MNQMPPPPSGGNSKRVSAGVLGILLGALGIHKFVLGYSKSGVIMLLVSIIGSVFFFLGPIIMGIPNFTTPTSRIKRIGFSTSGIKINQCSQVL